MEYFLILIVIILLIVTLTKKSGSGDMLHEFNALSRKLDKIVNDLQDINYKLNRLEVKLNLQEKTIEPEIKPEKIIAPPPPVEMPEEIIEDLPPAQENEVVEEKVPIEENIPSAKANRYSTYYQTEAQEEEISKGFWEEFKEKNPDIEKFIGENLISKIGIVILVLGISFFVKFAIDNDWINESGRVGIGILSGVILLGFSNYLHKEYKAFSSILVAGAITVFYFTIGYGFHKYQLYSQSVAFGIMVVITIFSTLISVYYQRQELAVLSIIGGFAVPFMVSTGEGNYVVLFTYILLLNIGMLVLSYFKNWDIVKVLSFAFTMIIYLFWFSEKYPPISPQAHDNALLFINAFYLIFLTVNIVDIIKNRPIHLGLKVAMLLLNTAITYFVSMHIMSQFHPNMRGLYTLGFSAINLGLTYMVYKRNIEQRNIIYLLLGLTLTFATLAIPVQFDGYYITLFWAGEALLLLWISYQSKQKAFFGSSIIVYLLMLISLSMDWGHYQSGLLYPIVFNSIFLTGLICNASIYGAYWLLRRSDYELTFLEQIKINANVFLAAGVVLSYLIGFFEANYQGNQYFGNMATSQSVIMAYHYIFTTIIIVAMTRYNDRRYYISLVLGGINLVLFLLFNAYQPFYEMIVSIDKAQGENLAFYSNFIYLACILTSLGVFFRNYTRSAALYLIERKFLIAALLIFIVFLMSNQLLIYILKYNVEYTPTYITAHFNLKYQLYKVLFPIIWGSLSLLYLAYGIKNKNRPVRIVSLALLLITVLKLFIYDIRNVSEGGKILAFILLGILILIMSFMYQKIKILILDDSKKDEL